MKTEKSHKPQSNSKRSKKNPFRQLMEDKERIAKAFQEDQPLSSLGIPFVKPL